MDFALILVLLTFFTGVVYLVDIIFFNYKKSNKKEPLLFEYSKSFFPVLLLVLVLRSFIFEPFRIPSGSMMPTLIRGDFIFVSKFAYGLRLPVINTKVLDIGLPKRGDVVVFRLPSDPKINYVKRLIGLPGDEIFYDQYSKSLTINGEVISIKLIGFYDFDTNLELGEEVLGDKLHKLLLMKDRISPGGVYIVPDNHYFMMGDNRDNSRDSRFDGVDFIPEENLVGKAVLIWMNWRWPSEGGPYWSRIGTNIE
ncbi:MAG: signal peptidase I [Pseudomonadota bacterium]|nr:signal peptidase I [Gammaproteobacteria bacterium]MEE2684401.1 signal peptidase I [Pseudomonadota bacterium]|tara:strand:+ start:1054 stop:1812 length:759 start_codon:yes stop_codon:yes gene_type:complete